MAEVKDTEQIAEKWARVTPQRTEDYAQGIQNPRRDWKGSTVAAASSWGQAVSQAVTDKRFEKGVAKAGSEKWQSKAASKGTERWGPGVSGSRGDYEEGFAPFREAIARVVLPPRFPAGDPRNIERVRVIASALRKAKLGQSS